MAIFPQWSKLIVGLVGVQTGKGFIPLDVVQELPLGEVQETTTRRRSFSNPATNDWVPAPATNPVRAETEYMKDVEVGGGIRRCVSRPPIFCFFHFSKIVLRVLKRHGVCDDAEGT